MITRRTFVAGAAALFCAPLAATVTWVQKYLVVVARASNSDRKSAFIVGWVLAGFLLYCLVPGGSLASAQEVEPDLMAEGLRVYNTKAKCDECHGWTGRGGAPADDPENEHDLGPSLLRSTIDRKTMIELLSCGTPGGQMPRYLAGAWTEAHPCYGMVAADLPPKSLPPAPYTLLQPSQIEAVATYVQEVYQGKGMTLEYCEKYYDPKSPACDRYR